MRGQIDNKCKVDEETKVKTVIRKWQKPSRERKKRSAGHGLNLDKRQSNTFERHPAYIERGDFTGLQYSHIIFASFLLSIFVYFAELKMNLYNSVNGQ